MNITSAESAVMEVLWRTGPQDADQLTAALAKSQAWSGTTVRSLLERLVRKKAVKKHKVSGRKIAFRPLIEREDYVHAESRDLIDRLFEGRLGSLCAQFADRSELTREDIAELKALIRRIENGR